MAGMDERRKDEGGIIIVGCAVLGLLLAVAIGGMFTARLLAARALAAERRAMEAEQAHRDAIDLSIEAQKNAVESATATTPDD
jgi:Na+/glutamate symporter